MGRGGGGTKQLAASQQAAVSKTLFLVDRRLGTEAKAWTRADGYL